MNNLKALSLGLLVLVLSSLASAVSTTAPSSRDERKLLCAAVEQLLLIEQVDAYVDTGCSQAPAVTTVTEDGTQQVQGPVVIKNREDRTGNSMTCEVTFKGEPTLGNVVGGIAEGLSCN